MSEPKRVGGPAQARPERVLPESPHLDRCAARPSLRLLSLAPHRPICSLSDQNALRAELFRGSL